MSNHCVWMCRNGFPWVVGYSSRWQAKVSRWCFPDGYCYRWKNMEVLRLIVAKSTHKTIILVVATYCKLLAFLPQKFHFFLKQQKEGNSFIWRLSFFLSIYLSIYLYINSFICAKRVKIRTYQTIEFISGLESHKWKEYKVYMFGHL